MFGLDARIALAIFGALSVISGAALYSAIQQSKVISLLADLNEVGKALEQYILDTGQEPPATSGLLLNARELITSSVSGWNGPYLAVGNGINLSNIDHAEYLEVGIVKAKQTGYSDGDPSTNDIACDSTTCDLYVYVNGVPHDIATAVDRYVDGSDSIDSGNVALFYGFTGASDQYNTGVALKIMPTINKP